MIPTGEKDPFNQFMFDRFDITVDQLEGEINLPYILERKFSIQLVIFLYLLLELLYHIPY